MNKVEKLEFRWVPGQGPDQAALERMSRTFPKPRVPMGEAWFLSPVRKTYPELLGDLDSLTDEQIDRPLEEIAGAPSCFGQLDEWTAWYQYLLPRVIQRRWGSGLQHPMEIVITGFMSQHPENGDRFAYPQFRSDALQTLGQSIMSPDCWPGGTLHATKCLQKYRRVDGIFGWNESDGLLSGSLFLCLKYLTEEEVGPWFESVIAIPNPYWTAQIVIWLIGAHPILTGAIEQPSELPEQGPHCITWHWSHALDGHYTGNFDEPIRRVPFLSEANRDVLFNLVRSVDFTTFIEEWQTDPELGNLAAETAGSPERFLELYGT